VSAHEWPAIRGGAAVRTPEHSGPEGSGMPLTSPAVAAVTHGWLLEVGIGRSHKHAEAPPTNGHPGPRFEPPWVSWCVCPGRFISCIVESMLGRIGRRGKIALATLTRIPQLERERVPMTRSARAGGIGLQSRRRARTRWRHLLGCESWIPEQWQDPGDGS
jgi:hypothetical protein